LATKRILFPGGAANFCASGGYGDAARHLYNGAILKNSQGDYFPVWGTCLGFELLIYLANGNKSILTDCDAENVALPLELKPGKSQLQDCYLFRYTNHQNATDIQQDRQSKYTVTLGHVRVTTVSLEDQ
jgi:hypothetical protein